eukprot:PhF_6_TR44482/c0_g1_i1/m.68494
MSRAARVRTESMAVKLAKQPISEGYALWDKGFILGAMRLFIFKAETVPPFQLAGCLDAIAHLMLQVEEFEDAIENLTNAAEKYEMIQSPLLAKVMRAKVLEAQNNISGAIAAIEDVLKEFDSLSLADLQTKDAKTKTGLARAFIYRAELRAANSGSLDDALKDANTAVALGWDRTHTGNVLIAQILASKGDLEGALNAYKAGTTNVNCFAAFEGAGLTLKQLKRFTEAQPFLDAALALHPKTALIRETAFTLAEAGNEAGALEFLEKYITHPPMEEMDPTAPVLRRTTLHKAKAAVLADGGKFEAALQTLEAAREVDSGDAEVTEMIGQIKSASQE